MGEGFCLPFLPFMSARTHMLSFILLFCKGKEKKQLSLQSPSHSSLGNLGPSHSPLLVATEQLNCLGSNEVQRQFPSLDLGMQQLLAAEGRH